MTLIRTYVIGQRNRHVLVCICDVCGVEFETLRYKLRHKQYHFCSRTCSNASQKSGVLKNRVLATNRAKFGCDYPTQNEDVLKKQFDTNLERYGVRSRLCIELQKFLEENGVQNSSQLPDHREKCENTSLRKRGVRHAFCDQIVRDKIKKTMLERYGNECCFKNDKVKEKIKDVMIERYGVRWYTQTLRFKNEVDWTLAAKKRHETMKQKGLYASSKAEDNLHTMLVALYGGDDVCRHKIVRHYEIDFYVKSLDVYVQLDGVYWHGLDRPIEEIERSMNVRDRAILATYFRDRKQNCTFKELGLRLVRLTDKQLKSLDKDLLKKIVEEEKGVGNGN